ncbi:molybdopterin-synthase adenylyltransferase MoeB [Candidatus Acetothermia bacterium]|nr:molybdopterin-synthase adenylyltransferase MoeB [Candidatus Acetothermia bacterium]
MLKPEQIERYSRQILLREIGGQGQKKLLDSKVLIVGIGGLGSPVALYLAAAGVGTLGLIDHEHVELSNLQRQILHDSGDVGQRKVESAIKKLTALNPEVKLIAHSEKLSSANALEILKNYDLIVDGSDNFPTRYLVNDACVILKKPNVFGSVLRFEGHVTVFAPGGPCYRCLFPAPPTPGTVPTCAEAGVLGTVTGLIGTLQANETLKFLLRLQPTLVGKLLLVDALTLRFEEIQLKKSSECPVCGTRPSIKKLIDHEEFCNRLKTT